MRGGLSGRGNSVFKNGEAEKDLFFFLIPTVVGSAEEEGKEMAIAEHKIDRSD